MPESLSRGADNGADRRLGRRSQLIHGSAGDFDLSARSVRHITSNSPSLAPSTNASHSDGVKISVSESTGFSELRIAT
jgi:hypothetical protein